MFKSNFPENNCNRQKKAFYNFFTQIKMLMLAPSAIIVNVETVVPTIYTHYTHNITQFTWHNCNGKTKNKPDKFDRLIGCLTTHQHLRSIRANVQGGKSAQAPTRNNAYYLIHNYKLTNRIGMRYMSSKFDRLQLAIGKATWLMKVHALSYSARTQNNTPSIIVHIGWLVV